jgi:glutamate racemase
MSTISPRASPAIAGCCATDRRSWSIWPKRRWAALLPRRNACARCWTGCSRRRAETGWIVNACTHFPLLEAELAAAAPHPVRFVDGGPGIARRVAYLTRDQDWPETPGPGRAVFTLRNARTDALEPALARFGLDGVESL